MGSTQAKIPPGVFLHQLFKPSIDLPTEEKSEDKTGAVSETVPEAVMVIHPDWTMPILEYLWHDRLPEDRVEAERVQRRGWSYVIVGDELYRKGGHGILIKCVQPNEDKRLLKRNPCGNLWEPRGFPYPRWQSLSTGFLLADYSS